MNVEIITAVKKRMKEELLPRQMEKLEIVLHEVFQEQENKKEKPCKEIYQCKKNRGLLKENGRILRVHALILRKTYRQ